MSDRQQMRTYFSAEQAIKIERYAMDHDQTYAGAVRDLVDRGLGMEAAQESAPWLESLLDAVLSKYFQGFPQVLDRLVTAAYEQGNWANVQSLKLLEIAGVKDGNPDNKQLVLGAVTRSDGIPIGVDVHDGNLNDTVWTRQVLRSIEPVLKAPPQVLFVADSKLVADDTVDVAILVSSMGGSRRPVRAVTVARPCGQSRLTRDHHRVRTYRSDGPSPSRPVVLSDAVLRYYSRLRLPVPPSGEGLAVVALPCFIRPPDQTGSHRRALQRVLVVSRSAFPRCHP